MAQNDRVIFPLSVERAVSTVEYRTNIIELGNRGEARIIEWDEGLIHFNAALGVRSLKDLQTLVRFHRSRKGRGRAFLVRDLLDHAAEYELLGAGDGTTAAFPLIKTYSDYDEFAETGNADVRRITRPEQGLTIYVDGIAQNEGFDFVLDFTTGDVAFVTPPASGASVTWTGRFYVPVRFVEDKLPADEIYFKLLDPSGPKGAGAIPDVPMIEVADGE
ncbi:MAG: DUF2460 domain-containing protein [Pyrinomonadaceae bacterium MAG19_C2-C3]|nr:DUF2460 domain-containing protein [Pyrinomonadaceae bacterium MAG19_C2-C3]